MASNLTNQLRNIADVTTAVAKGDLGRKITAEAKGEILELKNTINTMVDQLSSFAAEVTRVAREVGTEGILGGQANVPGVAGTWKDLTDSVNFMASNLTSQVRNIADVTTAVARGDLSRKITAEAKGEILELKNTVNTMVDQLNGFASEVTRVAREVGTEGILGGQANVQGVSGTWKDLTDSVNFMAGNLTSQVRNIALVTTAVANGDLSQKITVEAKGEVLELKNTVNTMVDQLNSFAAEVTRVAREVGSEGRLGGQANVPGVAGTWKDLTDSVNFMAGNLTSQVRNIADVTTAVAKGDLSKKITAEAKGEILELKNTVNTMVDQLNAFAAEVTRVAREVGTDGRLGGQANVEGVAGTWKDLTDSVNGMASNLTSQVRNIADVTTAVAKGDLSKKITAEAKGEILELKNTVNTMVDQLRSFADEVTRVAREVGTEGRLGGQANVPGVAGTWKDLTDSVNYMASNLTSQVRNIADVTTAVALGDLSRKITVDARGEILELKNTVNTMVEQLNAFASEVTRVAREVGSEGILGGQARVPGAGGVWRDLTDNVNFMASNLTSQVRNIALVTTAVANGDLSQKITVEARGEILELKNTVNTMVEKLRVFADEVTRVAKEVGTEGKLGGQAEVPGVAGTWKALTDSVNAMANSLTAQVRNIADVATAVTKGDLTRQITVEAQGELDELKSNINQMIANLKETTERNQEQDWLKTNLAKFSRMMQGQKDLESVSRLIMSELTPLVSAHHGAFFIMDTEAGSQVLRLDLQLRVSRAQARGQPVCHWRGAAWRQAAHREAADPAPERARDDYIQITYYQGLGEAPPRNIIVLPVLFEGEVKAVIELASFLPFSQIHQTFLDQLAESIGVVLNMIGASMRTEELLEQSQKLTQELQSQSQELQQQQNELKRSNTELEAQAKTLRQSEELLKEQQEELQQVNEELEEKASLLAEQNQKVEQKNREVEAARLSLEEKAEQLAISGKYKSEFLANMSHELRTPLNSLLILAKLLSDNKEGTLTPKQVEFSQTIYSSGTDLLNLINDILDLSKVEAGKMEVNPAGGGDQGNRELQQARVRTGGAPEGSRASWWTRRPMCRPRSYTDSQRLQQIIKNLLSNAFKFTDPAGECHAYHPQGGRRGRPVREPEPRPGGDCCCVRRCTTRASASRRTSNRSSSSPFQQADGTTSRKYRRHGSGALHQPRARCKAPWWRNPGGKPCRAAEARSRSSCRVATWNPRRQGSIKPRHRTRSRRHVVARDSGISRHQVGSSGACGDADEPTAHRIGVEWVAAIRRRYWRCSAAGSSSRGKKRRRRCRDDVARLAAPPRRAFDDDRGSIDPGDRVLLIIENDVNFNKILLEMAREKGFKGLCALDGDAGLKLAHAFEPDAITLDIEMPGMDEAGPCSTASSTIRRRATSRCRHIISGIARAGASRGSSPARWVVLWKKPVTKEALDEVVRQDPAVHRHLGEAPAGGGGRRNAAQSR